MGSGGVGKSCLTVRYLKDEFTNEYDPTIEENYRKIVTVDGIKSTITIVDTAGQQEYTSLRDHHLSSGGGFLLVFSLTDLATFEEIKQLRDKICNVKDTKKVPFVICGNKADLVDQREVPEDQIKPFCSKTKIPYFETSAKENMNVEEAFQTLVRECRRISGAGSGAGGGSSSETKKKNKKECIIQ